MGLLYDLQNLNREKLTVKALMQLAKRGAYAMINSGKIKGFSDKDGVPLIIYK